ncbi:MAG: type VI secretion system-associated FHA domain protein TagH [Rhizobacter sp.]|nr:type VI secretion system-associated FHA domain protein TagH [Rhizobacter sp.]
MLISLQLVGTPQGPVTDEPARRFDAQLVTIGRAPNCDVVLPDGLRIISRQHARIETQGASPMLSCLSASAPVHIGDKVVPAGSTMTLQDGEHIRVGGFELVLTVERPMASASWPAAAELDLPLPTVPPAEAAAGSPVRGRLDQWFDLEPGSVASARSGMPLARGLDPVEPPSPDPGANPPAPLSRQARPDLELPVDAPELPGDPGERPPSPDVAAEPSDAAAPVSAGLTDAVLDDLMLAFLEGAGLAARTATTSTRSLPPMHLTPAWMSHVGKLLRASVDGALALLHSRSAVKREMRAEVTVIARRQNNPLKFAPDAAAALAHLIGSRRSPGFLEPVAAVKDAHEDLLVHHLAVVAGMRAAMFELIARVGPEAVMHDEGPPKGLAMTIPTLHEAALWRRHCQRHRDLVARLDDDFEAVFGREFTKAYEAQARLVREQPPIEGPTG